MEETPITFEAEGLRLEGAMSLPSGARHGVVVCHPHPEYGGDMDNNVVTAVTSALGRAGVAALRFNFRGVGASEGRYSGAFGETADARGALDVLAERSGLGNLVLAGYSFGAMVASLAGAEDPRVDRVALVALPATMFDATELRRSPKPKLFVHGDRDQYCSIPALYELVASTAGTNEIHRVAGADHFFLGFEQECAAALVRFVTG